MKVIKGIESNPEAIYQAFRTKFRVFDMGGMPDTDTLKYITLLVDEGEIVGMLVTNQMRNRICYLAIAKEYQRKGYGKMLFEESCRIMDLNKFGMTLTSHNEESNKFWERMGFKVVRIHHTKKTHQKKYKMIYDKGLVEEWL